MYSSTLLDLFFPGGSSDDSYLSADEDQAEGPRFERPLEDTTAPSNSKVTLNCILTGNPAPTGTTQNILKKKINKKLYFNGRIC